MSTIGSRQMQGSRFGAARAGLTHMRKAGASARALADRIKSIHNKSRARTRTPSGSTPVQNKRQAIREQLAGVGRGETVEVAVTGSYRQGDHYTWKELCSYLDRINDPKDPMKMGWMKSKAEAAKHKLAHIPSGTLRRWNTDDNDYQMQKHNVRGVAGVAHYIVERDVRRRTELPAMGAPSLLTEGQKKKMMLVVKDKQNTVPLRKTEIAAIIGGILHEGGVKRRMGERKGEVRFSHTQRKHQLTHQTATTFLIFTVPPSHRSARSTTPVRATARGSRATSSRRTSPARA